ncbi:MAG: 4Fe-4S dicluster domain-containing protein [Opitutaceae bacterium]
MPPPQASVPGTPGRDDEFPAGASEWPADLDRRDFLRLGAAVFAAAGLGACSRPSKDILPYVRMPEDMVPGEPLRYASAALRFGYARGIVVETHLGRPTKIEGNPRHAESAGGTDAGTQASVIELYDPHRSQAPRRGGAVAAWDGFESDWLERRDALTQSRGRGWALLTEPATSPTMLAQIGRLLRAFPEARWYQHTALPRFDEDGVQEDLEPARADVLLAVEGDFLMEHPAALRYARGLADRRRVVHGRVDASRIYALESGWTAVGAMADDRLAVRPSRIPLLLSGIAGALGGGTRVDGLDAPERGFVARVARDLRARAPNVLCAVGAGAGRAWRRWTREMNRRLGAEGRTVRFLEAVRSDGDGRSAGDLAALAEAIDHGLVQTLCILGPNPAYTAPGDLDFEDRLRSVPYTVHMGERYDETGVLCRWHLPESDNLEAWGDARGYDGSAVVRQPMIDPMYATRSLVEMLRWFADGTDIPGLDLVRETWRGAAGGDRFDARWREWLNHGVIDPSVAGASGRRAAPPAGADADLNPVAPAEFRGAERRPGRASPAGEQVELVVRADPFLGDGSLADNPWLQENPRPFTGLVWDTTLWLGPAMAERLGVAQGDLIRVEVHGRSVEAPAVVVPGQGDGCAIAFLGGGRRQTGPVGLGRGYDAYRIRLHASPWLSAAQLRPVGRRYPLVQAPQQQFEQYGRDQARFLPAAELSGPRLPSEQPAQSLYPPWPRSRYAWGMLIDLSTCIGCTACVVACQAENNIPAVGKDQAARGRTMHWIRVNGYFRGTETARNFISQPVPCMHCEDAPCELVCPVGATVHSSEGLNEMIYNRCVGTRYCSNNCPYKVRRFNFLDYRPAIASPLRLQENPNVTVRERGVMEKCSYCVQRIEAARIVADREDRAIRDLEIRTACQQACPTEAIVFGNINDPRSLVSRRKAEPSHYALLAELNTRPRTTYLSRITNIPPPA